MVAIVPSDRCPSYRPSALNGYDAYPSGLARHVVENPPFRIPDVRPKHHGGYVHGNLAATIGTRIVLNQSDKLPDSFLVAFRQLRRRYVAAQARLGRLRTLLRPSLEHFPRWHPLTPVGSGYSLSDFPDQLRVRAYPFPDEAFAFLEKAILPFDVPLPKLLSGFLVHRASLPSPPGRPRLAEPEQLVNIPIDWDQYSAPPYQCIRPLSRTREGFEGWVRERLGLDVETTASVYSATSPRINLALLGPLRPTSSPKRHQNL